MVDLSGKPIREKTIRKSITVRSEYSCNSPQVKKEVAVQVKARFKVRETNHRHVRPGGEGQMWLLEEQGQGEGEREPPRPRIAGHTPCTPWAGWGVGCSQGHRQARPWPPQPPTPTRHGLLGIPALRGGRARGPQALQESGRRGRRETVRMQLRQTVPEMCRIRACACVTLHPRFL